MVLFSKRMFLAGFFGLAGTVCVSVMGMRRWDGAYAVRAIGGAGVEWLLRGSDRGDGEPGEAEESGKEHAFAEKYHESAFVCCCY